MKQSPPRLIAITDIAGRGAEATREMALRVCAALPGSVALLLRDKQLGGSERVAWARWLRRVTSQTGQHLLIAERADIGSLVSSDGVHLGETSVSCRDARRLTPEGRTWWMSRAWHDVHRLPDTGLDALLLSPAMAPRKGSAALGRSGLGDGVRLAAGTAVYALGGVSPENARSVLDCGCRGVAVMAAAYESAQDLLAALEIAP